MRSCRPSVAAGEESQDVENPGKASGVADSPADRAPAAGGPRASTVVSRPCAKAGRSADATRGITICGSGRGASGRNPKDDLAAGIAAPECDPEKNMSEEAGTV
jgi:hypothetical protein